MKETEIKTQNIGDQVEKKNSVIKKVLNTIINILIVIILVVSVFIAVMSLTSKANDGISVIFGHTIENIQTDSMKGGSKDYDGGDFETGDIIIGKFTGRNISIEYNTGDIVTYRKDLDEDGERELICHRIIDVGQYEGTRCYRTMGDNGMVADQPEGEYGAYITSGDVSSVFYSDSYHGTILKGYGKVLSFLQSKLGFFLCILVPMIIFFLYELIRVIFNFAYYRKAKEEEGVKDAESQKKAEIDAAVAQALADKEKGAEGEKLSPEQMEQFKKFLEQQKQQEQSAEKQDKE